MLLVGIALSACQTRQPPPPPTSPPEIATRPVGATWEAVARPEHRDRLDRIEEAWTEGLDAARGSAAQIRSEGELLDPDASLPRAALPPGSYRCRLVRLGPGPGRRAFTAYPSYFCHVGVENELLSFTKQTGSERPGGYLWDDGDRRMIFLGAMAQGSDSAPPAYGEDVESDLVGIVERVGPFRYRLVMPWPQVGARIDILELIPVVPVAE